LDKSHKIYVVHEGKASYPEAAAIEKQFGGDYEVEVCTPSALVEAESLDASACWHMMGFYPRKPAAKLVIHDYRSLSVGRFRRIKDFCKRVFNARPDLIVFQNEEIRMALGFPKDSRTIILPMGVPDVFVDSRGPGHSVVTDFIYIGSMLDERRCELMIDSFLGRFGNEKLFQLYGPRNPALEARYSDQPNVQFCGTVPQVELVGVLKQARVGVAYFPNHFPHILQAPTKLMEYGAVGMRILANEQPQNRAAAKLYGIDCLWGPAGDMFKDVPDELDWEDNQQLDASPMRWSSVFRDSGLHEILAAALR
jgi:hypothetical protein